MLIVKKVYRNGSEWPATFEILIISAYLSLCNNSKVGVYEKTLGLIEVKQNF